MTTAETPPPGPETESVEALRAHAATLEETIRSLSAQVRTKQATEMTAEEYRAARAAILRRI